MITVTGYLDWMKTKRISYALEHVRPNLISGTQKYLQLTAQMYPDIVTNLELQFGALIPQMEVANENI